MTDFRRPEIDLNQSVGKVAGLGSVDPQPWVPGGGSRTGLTIKEHVHVTPPGKLPANLDETVRRFIKRYGEDALPEAQRRARELEEEGDTCAAETWHQVTAAIAAQAKAGSKQVH